MAKNPHKEAQKKLVWRTNKYASKVGKLYSQAVNDLLDVTKKVNTAAKKGEMFSYEDNPEMAKAASDILRRLHSDTYAAVKHGIQLEWAEGNKAADQFLATHFGKQVLNDPNFAAWTSRNTDALEAFFKRTRDDGMTLSKRIWKQTKQLRGEMELAMTVSIGEGESAADISRRVRKYLKDPDKLFRRIKETQEDGSIKWKLSKAAAAYHPGRGMYRSSAKNAMRVARTETNIAYRTADAMRWEEMDFVTGVHVKLSHNHPTADICDVLQGIYPKNFVFKGWHPQCFCYAEPVTASYEDMVASSKAMLAGEQPPAPKDMVTELPDNFKKWVKENQGRIDQAQKNGHLPYFMKDNWDVIYKKSALQKAAERHAARTPEQIEAIKKKFKERQDTYKLGNSILAEFNGVEGFDTSILKKALKTSDWTGVRAQVSSLNIEKRAIVSEAEALMKELEKIKDIDTDSILSAIQKDKLNEIVKQKNILKSLKGEIMQLKELDEPIEIAKKYSFAEAKAVNAAIEKTFARWTWDFTTDDSLNFLRRKLETEIQLVENRKSKFSTWQVSRDAFQKRLDLVNKRIEMKSIKDGLLDDIKILQSARSQTAKMLLKNFDDAFANDATSLNALRNSAEDIKKKAESINAKKLKKSPQAQNVLRGVKMTDEQAEAAFLDYMASIGERVSPGDYKVENGVVRIDLRTHQKIHDKGLKIAKVDEDQTWSRGWKDGYIRTSNSFKINGCIRDVGGNGVNMIVGNIESAENKARLSLCRDKNGSKLTLDDIKTIKAMDNVLEQNSLPFPIMLIRNVDADAATSMFGLSLEKVSTSDAVSKIIAKNLDQLIPDPAFMSTSSNAIDNVFKGRQYQLRIEVPTGHPIYFTKNYHESECILGRHTKLRVRKIFAENGHVVVDAVIV